MCSPPWCYDPESSRDRPKNRDKTRTDDIKVELKSTDPFIKAEAIRKLTYLQMIGDSII